MDIHSCVKTVKKCFPWKYFMLRTAFHLNYSWFEVIISLCLNNQQFSRFPRLCLHYHPDHWPLALHVCPPTIMQLILNRIGTICNMHINTFSKITMLHKLKFYILKLLKKKKVSRSTECTLDLCKQQQSNRWHCWYIIHIFRHVSYTRYSFSQFLFLSWCSSRIFSNM